MSAQLSPTPVFKGWANDGTPLAYGLLSTYAAGTTTPQATYIDSTLTTQNTNPIVLDARGECALWLDPTLSYKFNLTDKAGNQISRYPVDNIPGFLPLDSLNIHYDITPAESAASVTPTNYSYPPGHILRYGTNTTPGTTDMTSALQAAINQNNQGGSAVYAPRQIYKFASNITLYAGTKITGDGWAAQAGSFAPVAGTVFNFAGSGVFLTLHGVSTGNYAEALTIRDLAIYNSGGTANCVALQIWYAPFSLLENLYIAGFSGSGSPGSNGTGIEQANSSWHCIFTNVNIQGCTTCLNAHDAGEDSNYINCVFRSFNYSGGIGVYLNGQAQTNKFTNCDLSDNLYGCLISQGDSNGNGTGTPLPMQVTFDTCQFEQCNNFAVGISTSNGSYASNNAYPSVILTNCRFYIPAAGGSVTPNNGQALIYAQACGQITIQSPTESGYSYGAIVGISQFGFTFSGSAKPGPVTFINDAYVYGTARVISGGQNGSLVTIPGDKASIRFTSTALTTGALAAVPFSVLVGADTWGWTFVSGITTIRPTKNQTVRFKCQLAFASGPATSYLLQLYKNSSLFQTIAATTLGTAGNPFVLSGEGFDIPNGTSDYYYVVITTGSAGTVDTTNSYLEAEVVGE